MKQCLDILSICFACAVVVVTAVDRPDASAGGAAGSVAVDGQPVRRINRLMWLRSSADGPKKSDTSASNSLLSRRRISADESVASSESSPEEANAFSNVTRRHHHDMGASNRTSSSSKFWSQKSRRSSGADWAQSANQKDAFTKRSNVQEQQREFYSDQARHWPPTAVKVLRAAVIAPSDIDHQYSLKKILPTVTLAARKIERMGRTGRGPLPGWKIQILNRDSRCSSIYGPLEAFDLYNSKAVGQAIRWIRFFYFFFGAVRLAKE